MLTHSATGNRRTIARIGIRKDSDFRAQDGTETVKIANEYIGF